MVLGEILQTLRSAVEQWGLDQWALARRLDVGEEEVAAVFTDGVPLTVDLLISVANALDLEVALQHAPARSRIVGPIPSVVDLAVSRITGQRPASAGITGARTNDDIGDMGAASTPGIQGEQP